MRYSTVLNKVIFEAGLIYEASLTTGYSAPLLITKRTEKSIWYKFWRNNEIKDAKEKERRTKIQDFDLSCETACPEGWYLRANQLWDTRAQKRHENWND